MGDIGDYWNEHKAHKRRVSMGITLADERRWERERAKEKKQAHMDKCTIKCECGKWLLDKAAHNCHKQRWGKEGHKILETRVLEPIPDYAEIF